MCMCVRVCARARTRKRRTDTAKDDMLTRQARRWPIALPVLVGTSVKSFSFTAETDRALCKDMYRSELCSDKGQIYKLPGIKV